MIVKTETSELVARREGGTVTAVEQRRVEPASFAKQELETWNNFLIYSYCPHDMELR